MVGAGRAPLPQFGHRSAVRHCNKCFIPGGLPRPVPRPAIPCRTSQNPFGVSGLVSLSPTVVVMQPVERVSGKDSFYVYQVRVSFSPSDSCDTKGLPPAPSSGKPAVVEPFHYVDSEGVAQGPLTLRELQALWDQKSVTASTFVICHGARDWTSVESQPDLLDTLTGELGSALHLAVSTSEMLEKLAHYFLAVERRYSDFVWLHKTLSRQLCEEALPVLPSAAPFASNNEKFREQRRIQLQQYLNGLICHPKLQHNEVLKAWLCTTEYVALAKEMRIPEELASAIDVLSALPLYLCYILEKTQLDQCIGTLERHKVDHETRMQQFHQISKQLDAQLERHKERMETIQEAPAPAKHRIEECEIRVAQAEACLIQQQGSVQMLHFDRAPSREQHSMQKQVP